MKIGMGITLQWRLSIGAMLAAALLASCADKLPVKVERDPAADLTRYATYAWMGKPRDMAGEKVEDIFSWRVRNAVDMQLAGKGYVPAADPEQAALVVEERTVIEDKETNTIGDYMRYKEEGGTEPLFNAYTIGYEQAKLSIEMFDATTRQLVWRGVGLVSMDAKNRSDRAAALVVEMFKQFPRR